MNWKILVYMFLAMPITEIFMICNASLNETIYINTDGDVYPPITPIQRQGNIYIFRGNIYNPIVVNKSDIIIDGDGYSLECFGLGFYLDNVANVTIRNVKIQACSNSGIYLHRTSNNTIHGNIISMNGYYGIQGDYSSGNKILANVITSNRLHGIAFRWSCNNNISDNNISNNGRRGIYLDESDNNIILGNIIENNSDDGIHMYLSDYNYVGKNTITANKFRGILIRYKSSENEIIDNKVVNNYDGIYVEEADNNVIARNMVIENRGIGINIRASSENLVYENKISSNNDSGVNLYLSFKNNIWKNNISYNNGGIYLSNSFNNTVYNNNFSNNFQHYCSYNSTNFWDNGFEGNYWSNFTNIDLNNDGIGELPYQIDEENSDNYPLMGMFQSFAVLINQSINVISNRIIKSAQFTPIGTITLHLENSTDNQQHSFCRIWIPKSLITPPYIILLDNNLSKPTHLNKIVFDNETHTCTYIEYSLPTYEIIISSSRNNNYETTSLIITVLFAAASLTVFRIYKKGRGRHTCKR